MKKKKKKCVQIKWHDEQQKLHVRQAYLCEDPEVC